MQTEGKQQPKTITIQARVTVAEKKALEQEARNIGVTLSELIRAKSTNSIQQSFKALSEAVTRQVAEAVSAEVARGREAREKADHKLVLDLNKLLNL